MSNPIGEVIAANTAVLTAEVPAEAGAPAFGAWVKIPQADGSAIYAVVSLVERGSLMPNRQATAFGMAAEELKREMPQVVALLRTTFQARVVGYADDAGRIRQTLAPATANFHDFVYACSTDELQSIHPPFDFLRILSQATEANLPVDDLMIASLSPFLAAQTGDDVAVAAGRMLSRLMNDDHERLQSILRRIG